MKEDGVKRDSDVDVLIVGAGPSGSVAAALLRKRGYSVVIIEREIFPRFSIGESLLPQCMELLEEADMLDEVERSAAELGFQPKNGAAFVRREAYVDFDFREKFSEGWGTTYQVTRESFDLVLANAAQEKGADIRFAHTLVGAEFSSACSTLNIVDDKGRQYSLSARYVLDASGFGRVLPRMLKLERPSCFPARVSLFTHIKDNIPKEEFDREKIRVTIHPEYEDVWIWLIPFANGRSSIGVVSKESFLADFQGRELEKLKAILFQSPSLKKLLRQAVYDTPVRQICGYSCNVSQLWGEGYALLGNAGEFLDPIFSSGVTIAMKSASLAVAALDRHLQGLPVDWEAEYAVPLKQGVNTFRAYVEAWYDGRFQDVIFSPNQPKKIKEMISSVLAGYAWDRANPYVAESERRLNTLAELCKLT